MTTEEYQKAVLDKITALTTTTGELRNAINLLTEKMASMEERTTAAIQLVEGRVKGNYELLSHDMIGISKRFDEKIAEHECTLCAIKDEVDLNTKNIIAIQTKFNFTWAILGAIGVGLIGLIIEVIGRIIP